MERKKIYEILKNIAKKELDIRGRAAKIHADVNQTYGDCNLPYSYHINMVAYYTARYMNGVIEKEEDVLPVLFGAYFHDTIEDARLSYNDVKKIAREYMDEGQAFMAAEIVYALTNEKGRTRHERANSHYYEGIRNTKYAPLVKAADRLANYEFSKSGKGSSGMAKAYEREMESFIKNALFDDNGYYLVPDDMVDELKEGIIK